MLGMVAAHLLVLNGELVWSDASTWLHLVEGRSSILFAVLAGVSIGLVTGGTTPVAKKPMQAARVRLALRAAMLWVLGVALVLTGVPVYVILPAYAILFLLTLPFTALSAGRVLAWAAALGLVMPFLQPMLNTLPFWSAVGGAEAAAMLGWNYPFTVWIAFILAGLALTRLGLSRFRTQLGMLVIGAALAAVSYATDATTTPAHPYHRAVWSAAPHSSGVLEVFGSGGFAIAVLAVCLLLCRLRLFAAFVLPLRATGSMPLTAYTLQLVAWAVVASVLLGTPSDLAGFRALDPFWPMMIGVVLFCTAWALLRGRGPLEAVLDRLTRIIASGNPGLSGR